MISILIGYDGKVTSRLVKSMHRRTEQLYRNYKGSLYKMLGWLDSIGRRSDNVGNGVCVRAEIEGQLKKGVDGPRTPDASGALAGLRSPCRLQLECRETAVWIQKGVKVLKC